MTGTFRFFAVLALFGKALTGLDGSYASNVAVYWSE